MTRRGVVDQHQQQMCGGIRLRCRPWRSGGPETYRPFGEILCLVGHSRSVQVSTFVLLWTVTAVRSSVYCAIAVAAGIADWIRLIDCWRSPAARAFNAWEICDTAGLSLGLLV